MEKGIEDLKQFYLKIKPPIEIEDGIVDVFNRIDRTNPPFYFSRIFLAIVLFLLVSTGIAGAVLFSTDNSTFQAVKVKTQKVIEKTFNIQSTSVPVVKKDIKKKTTPTPTQQPIISPTNKPTSTPGLKISEEKHENSNNQNVKGISTTNLQQSTPVNSNSKSQEHKNENAQINQNINADKNHSSEKSNNGKKK